VPINRHRFLGTQNAKKCSQGFLDEMYSRRLISSIHFAFYSAAAVTAPCRHRPGRPVSRRSRPRNLHQCRCFNEATRHEDCVGLFRGSSTAEKFAPVSAGLCLPVACRVTHPHAAGLRQRDTDWHSTTSHSSAAVGHERHCTLDPFGLKVPAYHTAPASAPLTEGSGAD
jgi:hypothetical protein